MGRIYEDTLGEGMYRKFIGGRGLATKYLSDEVREVINPLGPKNRLLFMNGPLGATISPSVKRYDIVAKFLLTGI
jgi:aldehyde:ferredoxin oxidoreductase